MHALLRPAGEAGQPGSGCLLDAHLARLVSEYDQKATLLADLVEAKSIGTAHRPTGGYFLWVQLPPGATACIMPKNPLLPLPRSPRPRLPPPRLTRLFHLPGCSAAPGVHGADLLPVAQSLGVAFLRGSRCFAGDTSAERCGGGGTTPPGEDLDQWMRLCFAWLTPEEIVQGSERLALAVQQVKRSMLVGEARRRVNQG